MQRNCAFEISSKPTHLLPFMRLLPEADPLLKREARERWRRPFTFVLLGVYGAFLSYLAFVFYGALVPQGDVVFSKVDLGLGAPVFWRFVRVQTALWIPLGLCWVRRFWLPNANGALFPNIFWLD